MAISAREKYARGFVNGRTRRVLIGGIEYPSGKTAALAPGMTHSNLVRRIKRGDGIYLD